MEKPPKNILHLVELNNRYNKVMFSSTILEKITRNFKFSMSMLRKQRDLCSVKQTARNIHANSN